jgi:hypothetical protein
MQPRQGDILIDPIKEIPESNQLTNTNEIVLAHGEATGHKHAFYETENVKAFAANDNTLYLHVIETTNLCHEEHNSIPVSPDKYEVIRQRQWIYGKSYQVAD